jgi:dihydroorotate dehydrogenase electron transfer subunit
MRPISSTILDIRDETPTIKTFKLDVSHWLKGKPGQYVMVWIRGVDEVPMTLSYNDSITVQKVGDATEALFNLKPGDTVGIRGPYGNGWELVGDRILIISGGVGSAPLVPFAEKAASIGVDVTTIAGFRTKDEVHFENRLKKAGIVYISTDDGTYGQKGFVTDLLKTLDLNRFTQVYCCGPEKMMSRVLGMLDDAGVASKSQFSIQRYIKCGIGVCGSCCIDPEGLRVCREGPVFNGEVLLNSEMGKYARDASGRRKKI